MESVRPLWASWPIGPSLSRPLQTPSRTGAPPARPSLAPGRQLTGQRASWSKVQPHNGQPAQRPASAKGQPAQRRASAETSQPKIQPAQKASQRSGQLAQWQAGQAGRNSCWQPGPAAPYCHAGTYCMYCTGSANNQRALPPCRLQCARAVMGRVHATDRSDAGGLARRGGGGGHPDHTP